jgi:hypothetical protein
MNGDELRDVFAIQALNGMIASGSWLTGRKWKTVEEMTADYSKEAYNFADAMLKARNETS